MENKTTLQDTRKRNALLLMPLLVIPFLTLAFWALGGGADNADANVPASGLNLQLPDPNLKEDKKADKMTFYEKAEKDSVSRLEKAKNDPFYNRPSLPKDTGRKTISTGGHTLAYDPYPLPEGLSADPNEEKVYRKLAELNAQLQGPSDAVLLQSAHASGRPEHHSTASNRMKAFDALNEPARNEDGNRDTDPEMAQLNSMLEKILDIQHPERIKEQGNEKSTQPITQVLSVSKEASGARICLLDTTGITEYSAAGFYSEAGNEAATETNAIVAVVHQTQALVTGGVLKLRLLDDLYIGGNAIAKGTFVFGTAALQGERLRIAINSVRDRQALYPVSLELFDLDGMAGIYVPGALTRDVAEAEVGKSLEMLQLTSGDPSLKVQAAATGINAAKSLLSKKTKQVKVWVKEGYKVLLKSKNSQS